MIPYRSSSRAKVIERDAFRHPPKHPRITIYPATTTPPIRTDYAQTIVWGMVVALVIVLVDALVR